MRFLNSEQQKEPLLKFVFVPLTVRIKYDVLLGCALHITFL